MAKKKSSRPKKKKESPPSAQPVHDEKLADARHEAGHAVVAVHYDIEVVSIDIIPQLVPGSGGLMGKAGVILGLPEPRLMIGVGGERVIPILHTLCAGFQAERKINPNAGLEIGHAASDGVRAQQYSAAALCRSRAEMEQKADEISALTVRAMNEAETLVKQFEAEIDALADLVYRKGHLTGLEVNRFLASLT
jgi:hypothetical protein